MGAQTNRDFASLLDDLFVATEQAEEAGPRPTIPFDYLAVAEELHSGRIRVSNEEAAAEYEEATQSFQPGFSALLSDFDKGRDFDNRREEPASEPLPSIEPEAIAIELGLSGAATPDFGLMRRRFAFANHPDRVAPHLRQHALARMQVANGLIDEARRRALAKSRG